MVPIIKSNFQSLSGDTQIAGRATDIIIDSDTAIIVIQDSKGVKEDFRVMRSEIADLQLGDQIQMTRMESLDGDDLDDETVFCANNFKKAANINESILDGDNLDRRAIRLNHSKGLSFD